MHVYVITAGHYVQAVRLTRQAAERYAETCPWPVDIDEYDTEEITRQEQFKRLGWEPPDYDHTDPDNF